MKTCLAMFTAAALAITATAQTSTSLVFIAKEAKIADGGNLKLEVRDGIENLGVWDSTKTVARWSAAQITKGTYRVIAAYSCSAAFAGSEFEVTVANQRAGFTVPSTGGWLKYQEADLGPIMIRRTGPAEITARVTRIANQYGINIRAIKLVPAP